jgi:hypothetical protein
MAFGLTQSAPDMEFMSAKKGSTTFGQRMFPLTN